MRKELEIEQMWHNDGHQLILRIEKAELIVSAVICPNRNKESLPGNRCMNRDGICAVEWFIERYGMDCNGGICDATSPLSICWTLIGDHNDYESSQLWFMPMNDEIFQAWLISNEV